MKKKGRMGVKQLTRNRWLFEGEIFFTELEKKGGVRLDSGKEARTGRRQARVLILGRLEVGRKKHYGLYIMGENNS